MADNIIPTDSGQPCKSFAQVLFEEIKERDEQTYAMVKAIQNQLRRDLDPQLQGMTSTTEHLLNVLHELLTDHTVFYQLEKELPKYREVQA